ncbi:Putative histone-fold [Septoria linicola]|uniref:Histone-fold n=1 Tax=Septoria linicola TaxID=215465 RepID=A0A9Q9ALU8_9PEZI|nr:putative histone-fold [Septoria linicola]USW48387.1 Putative histone-fold [Septoria linicola]
MAGNSNATQNDEDRLKAALWHSIGKTIDAVAVDQHINAAPTFIAGVTEMVSARISTIAADLEAFARHAERTTINANDAVLLARHNDTLRDVLQQKADNIRKQDRSSVRG